MPTDGVWFWVTAVVPAACWGLFLLVWVSGAIYNRRHGPATRERNRLSWAALALLVIDLVLAVVVPERAWAPVTTYAHRLLGTGAVLLVAATGFTLWARVALGTMWTSAPVIKQDHTLRTTGPYAVTRHPIYTGISGMLVATACVSGLGKWLAFVAVALAYLMVKVRAEERMLDETFGEAYRSYRRRVPMLVPRPVRAD